MEHQLLMVSSQFLSMEEMIELQVNALQRSREIMAKAGIFLDVPLMDDFEVRNETDELLLMAGAPGSAVRKPRSPTQPGESNTQVPLDDGPEGAADSALALETDEVPSTDEQSMSAEFSSYVTFDDEVNEEEPAADEESPDTQDFSPSDDDPMDGTTNPAETGAEPSYVFFEEDAQDQKTVQESTSEEVLEALEASTDEEPLEALDASAIEEGLETLDAATIEEGLETLDASSEAESLETLNTSPKEEEEHSLVGQESEEDPNEWSENATPYPPEFLPDPHEFDEEEVTKVSTHMLSSLEPETIDDDFKDHQLTEQSPPQSDAQRLAELQQILDQDEVAASMFVSVSNDEDNDEEDDSIPILQLDDDSIDDLELDTLDQIPPLESEHDTLDDEALILVDPESSSQAAPAPLVHPSSSKATISLKTIRVSAAGVHQPERAAIRISPNGGAPIQADEELLEAGDVDDFPHLDAPAAPPDNEQPNLEEAPISAEANSTDPKENLALIEDLMDKAYIAYDNGNLSQAIAFFSDVIDAGGGQYQAFLGRGRIHLDMGDYSRAMSDFTFANDLDPNNPNTRVALGDLYFTRKDYEKAIIFFSEALEAEPDHAMAACRRGISHYYRKAFSQALTDLTLARKLDPSIPNIATYVSMAKKKTRSSSP